jgi:hypothetical protein
VGIIAPGRKDIGIKNAESAFHPTINRPTGCLLALLAAATQQDFPKIFLIATAITRKLKQETSQFKRHLTRETEETKS